MKEILDFDAIEAWLNNEDLDFSEIERYLEICRNPGILLLEAAQEMGAANRAFSDLARAIGEFSEAAAKFRLANDDAS